MAVERTRTPDTGAETTDKPQDEKPPPPPADRPGTPGQPSRLESRAAARAPEKNTSTPSDRPGDAPEGKPTGPEQRIPTPVNWSPRRASREAAAQPQDTSATPPPPLTAPDNWSPRRESREAARDAQAASSPKPENEDKQPSTATENTEGPHRTSNDAATSAATSADRRPSPGSPSTTDISQPDRPEATPTDARTKPDQNDQPSSQSAADSPPSPAEPSEPKADEPPDSARVSNTDALGQTHDVTDPNKSGPQDVTTAEEQTKNADAQSTTDDPVSADTETPRDASTWSGEPESRQHEPTAKDDGASTAQDQTPDSLQAIEARAKAIGERYGVDVNFTDRPIHPDYARLITEAMESLSSDYPSIFKGLDEIRAQNLPEMQARRPLADNRVIAFATPREVDPPPQGIYLNQHWFADVELFNERGSRDEQRGSVVPKGGTPEGVFYHEFGHHIGRRILADPALRKEMEHALKEATGEGAWDLSLPKLGFPKQKNIVINDLSDYGSTNPSEMLAEAFTEWKLSSNPRPLASAVGKVMDKHFKGVD